MFDISVRACCAALAFAALSVFASLSPAGGVRAETQVLLCGQTGLCIVQAPTADGPTPRTYRVRAPAGWDGATPLPVLLHFHGAGRNSRFVLTIKRLTEPTAKAGFLFVSLDARKTGWDFASPDSDDIAAANAVIADLAKRAPIMRDKVLVSGFSNGGAMAWRLACASGDAYAGYISIAGVVDGLDPTACPGGPARMIQVHGRRDRAMSPPLGALDDPTDDFVGWRRAGGCAAQPDETRTVGRFECRHWTRCEPGASAALCLTNGHHENPKKWLDLALMRLLEEIMAEEPLALGEPAADPAPPRPPTATRPRRYDER